MAICGVVILARQVRFSLAQLAQDEADAAHAGMVLLVAPGDVATRDVPKVRELLHGRLFSDPHYQGEANWYPFAYPLLVAGWCKITGSEISHGYFVLEILLNAALLVVAALAILRLGGVSALWLVPIAVWQGWLGPMASVYPWETARLPLCLCFILAGSVQRDIYSGHQRCWPALSLGIGVGLLGVWNGASFFAALVMTGVLALWDLTRAWDTARWRARLGVWAGAAAAGLAIFSLLLVPQLVKYGRVGQPSSARLFLQEVYGGGKSLAQALSLDTCPKGMPGLLALVFLLAMVFPPLRQRFPRLRNFGTPLAVAYLVCELLGLSGFGIHDREHPFIAALLEILLPAPPPTFYIIALWSFAFLVYCGGLWSAISSLVWLVEWCGRRFSWSVDTVLRHRHRVGLLASMAAFIVLVPTFPLGQPRHSQREERGLVDFGKKVEAKVGDGTVYVRDPFRLLAAASPRILLMPNPDHGNHYAQPERTQAVADLHFALKKGRSAVANEILDRYDVRALVEDARSKKDLVLVKCAGAILAEYRKLRLRERRPCSP